ncbi:MAG TPA: aminotransferase class IV, partial [Acidimicrobiia bacterium]|nr:aminotransferase class IV [Acidimicrobiia bacterium]
MTAWINGALVPVEDAHVSVLDHGITVGDGVFETMRVYRGEPFAWTRHIARLHVSADGIGLPLPDDEALRAAVDEVMLANKCIDARLRITITGGVAPPGSGRADSPTTVFVLAFPIDPPARSAEIVVAPWTINENGALAGLKTISYGANVRALAYAREHGASEALFANTQGNVCEATGSNVFCV